MATCKGTKKDGTPCKARHVLQNGYCPAHQNQAPKTFLERAQAWWRGIQLRNRVIGVVVCIATIGLLILGYLANAIQVFEHFRDSTSTPTALQLPTPTPFTTPAAEGEYLIIVAQFKDESEARNLDVCTVLADGINAALPDDIDGHAVAAHGVVPINETEARNIGEGYNATVILWGRYADNLVEVNFTPLVELGTPTTSNERLVTHQSVDELAVFVNDLADGPVRWLSLLTIGQVLYQRDRHDEAIACFDTALTLLQAIAPEQGQIAATYFYRGSAHFAQGDPDAATADLDLAIELDPNNTDAYTNRGLVHALKGEIARAIVDYDRAIEIRSENTEAYNNRGAAYMAQGDYERAIADFSQLIALQPNSAKGYNNRATAYLTLGKYVNAIADFDLAIQLEINDATIYYNRGRAFELAREKEKALADFQKVLELSGDESLREQAEEHTRRLMLPLPAFAWAGQIVNAFGNCGITRLFGFTLDRHGGLAGDVWVHYWANDWNGAWAKSQWIDFGAETSWKGDEGNWDATIDVMPREGTWHVCVVSEEGSGDCMSNTVDVITSSDCQNGVQVVAIGFRQN